MTDAKARFSAVVQLALDGTPQRVVRNGREAVIVVSEAAFARNVRPTKSLIELFAPIRGTELEMGTRSERDREAPSL